MQKVSNENYMLADYKYIDSVLEKFYPYMKNDMNGYSNHVKRVFLYCISLDRNKSNHQKYAISAVFHDLGIWTDNTFDYLNPSIQLAKEYLNSIGKGEWFEEVSLMIDNHHKISTYEGKYPLTVETFRKADWTDISLGFLKYGIYNGRYREISNEFPNKGFHKFIISQSFKRLISHPLNPLPMFKK